jgi:hypothetical protein
MVQQAFTLQPFGALPAGQQACRLEGWLERSGGSLTLEFQLQSDSPQTEDAILWPRAASAPQRLDGLWQHTCLEWFVAQPQQDTYWEFNLSPSGDWNVYQLDGYRQGLRPDPTWSALPLRRRDPEPAAAATESEPTGTLELHLTTTLPPELAAAAELEAAVTAVLQEGDGSCSYWALRHPGEQADFHRRDGFALRL